MTSCWKVLALVALFAAGPAWAHHSYAMFDFKNKTTIVGTVSRFEWTNPHSWMHVVVAPAPGGPTETWEVEMGPPGQLERSGWSRTSLKPGDKVEVSMAPMRDGSTGGHLASVKTLADGKVLNEPFFLAPGAASPAK